MSSGVESYRQLENRYSQTLTEYQREEAAYRAALDDEPDDPKLAERYRALTELRRTVEELYSQLTTMRSDLAKPR